MNFYDKNIIDLHNDLVNEIVTSKELIDYSKNKINEINNKYNAYNLVLSPDEENNMTSVISMLPQFQVTMLHSNWCIYVNHIVPSAHYRADHFGTAFRANNSNLIFLVF